MVETPMKSCMDCGGAASADRCSRCSARIGGIPWDAERNKILDIEDSSGMRSLSHFHRVLWREDDDERYFANAQRAAA